MTNDPTRNKAEWPVVSHACTVQAGCLDDDVELLFEHPYQERWVCYMPGEWKQLEGALQVVLNFSEPIAHSFSWSICRLFAPMIYAFEHFVSQERWNRCIFQAHTGCFICHLACIWLVPNSEKHAGGSADLDMTWGFSWIGLFQHDPTKSARATDEFFHTTPGTTR